ncbi:tetraacyldisaccharide 4'-kinase [Simiduia aestuariiviva]|uniref:Tetraacyldisaccharide 4'-kinase n=1 Tax=Simiduia aestuariiviva TaxID=1510459 RepID=A0A839USW6_9GAMM|nr:tetraacyldisaccharide 4'-kinase [Simiduia aestuariiviva]MBB3168465.1 tetraacyldisaccharide 4'-kinase [Simiduia aestuariiviva]
MQAFLLRAWYQGDWRWWLIVPLLLPLNWLMAAVTSFRRKWLTSRAGAGFNAPVIVVGNISLGGTGKTPLIISLTESLIAKGWRPGIVSRGYGGQSNYPLMVKQGTPTSACGDEPKMLAERTGVPLVVDPLRRRAVEFLLAQSNCNIVLSDDGLQHYALYRDVEIAVLDGARGLGNGWLLPIGPLRESARRLQEVDCLVINQSGPIHPSLEPFASRAIRMQLSPTVFINVRTGEQRSLTSVAEHEWTAVCGIGNPDRFYRTLADLSLQFQPKSFPDHHAYNVLELQSLLNEPVLMTEKDAVKCRAFAGENWWYLQVSPSFSDALAEQVLACLATKNRAR